MKSILITGGSGFIGTNLAHRLLSLGHRVYILDNLSRLKVEKNLNWLLGMHTDLVQVEIGDVRNRDLVRAAVSKVDHVFHLAAQVAVTNSIDDPRSDFDINALGTLILLEEIRKAPVPPSLIFTSTNKVYGALENLKLNVASRRYVRGSGADHGIDESCPLDFHSPYGCSKGAAEQYVLDYHRTYGLRTAVFRMSCIYGPHQFGNEDQGWIAHILNRALSGERVTIYGDGKQVRDILFIEDLVDALLTAHARIDDLAGEAFNIGGGRSNTISLLELLDHLQMFQAKPPIQFSEWRTGDQKYYVSDIRKFASITGWGPRVTVEAGIRALHGWLMEASESALTHVTAKES
jgi:CDP-paratose 2-epimerase